MKWLLIIIYILLSVGGQILFKYGANKKFEISVSSGVISGSINWICFAGVVCYAFSFFLFLYLISKYDLSSINPLLVGMTYVLSLVCALTVLHEKVNLTQGIGIAVIFIGVLLVTKR